MSLNTVAIYGNLTRDPEVRDIAGGTKVCDLSIGVNEKFKVNGEQREKAHFFDITVFGVQAEMCGRYLEKGRAIIVTGRLSQDRWEDRDTGKNRSKVKIIANSVQFLSSGKEGSQRNANNDEYGGGAAPASGTYGGGGIHPASQEDDSDIPF